MNFNLSINTWISFPLSTSLIRLQALWYFSPFSIAIVIKQERELNLKIRLELPSVFRIWFFSEKNRKIIFYFLEEKKYRNFEMNRQCFAQNDAQNEVERTYKLRLWKDSNHLSDETAKRQLKIFVEIFVLHPFKKFSKVKKTIISRPWENKNQKSWGKKTVVKSSKQLRPHLKIFTTLVQTLLCGDTNHCLILQCFTTEQKTSFRNVSYLCNPLSMS